MSTEKGAEKKPISPLMELAIQYFKKDGYKWNRKTPRLRVIAEF